MEDSRFALAVSETVSVALSILPMDIGQQLMVTRLDICSLYKLKMAKPE